MLIFFRNDTGDRADAVKPAVVEAEAAVPFAEPVLFDKATAVLHPEAGAHGEIFQEDALRFFIVRLERPRQHGVAFAGRFGVSYLVDNDFPDIRGKNVFHDKFFQESSILPFPGRTMRLDFSAVFFPGEHMGDLMGESDEEFIRVHPGIQGDPVDPVVLRRAEIAQLAATVSG